MNSTKLAQRFQHVMTATLAGFADSLDRYIPPSPYRDFCCWAISDQNPHRDTYLQALGMTQLAKLTVKLLDGLVDDRDWQALVQYIATMNTYLLYETVSDNLAIGLAAKTSSDLTYAARRKVLHGFNDAMTKRLQGDPHSSAQLLRPLQSAARDISIFDQSLIRSNFVMLAQAFLKQRRDLRLSDLEYSLWPMLVVNVESCATLADSMNGYRAGPVVREGLASRYQSVNCLLDADTLNLQQMTHVGTFAILVIPTLAYYIGILAEIVRPHPAFAQLIDDGTITSALYHAALLVRLLNDVGTRLILLPAAEQKELLDSLQWRSKRYAESAEAITTLLADAAEEHELFTRIHKDIMFGEFNVSLHNLAQSRSVSQALETFGYNLSYFSQLYQDSYARLRKTLAMISARLHDETVSNLILRFVQFHEALYSESYMTSAGEYAA